MDRDASTKTNNKGKDLFPYHWNRNGIKQLSLNIVLGLIRPKVSISKRFWGFSTVTL